MDLFWAGRLYDIHSLTPKAIGIKPSRPTYFCGTKLRPKAADRLIAVSMPIARYCPMTTYFFLKVSSTLAFEHRDEYELEQIQKREEEIDLYNAQLSRRISRVLAVENSPSEVNALNRMFSIIGNVERIGDHATNIAGYARTMMERRLELSSQASVELADMRTSCMRAVHLICSACCVNFTFAPEQESPDKRGSLTEHDAPAEHISLPQHASLLEQALLLEQDIDSRTARYRSNQIERMRKGKCHVETSILYSEILTDYERIGDHAFNIAQALDKLDEN